MAATGVTFRTGLRISSGERVAFGLVLMLENFDCVIDNARCFAESSFPAGGSVLLFGDLPIYVTTVPESFPREIVSFADPLPSACSTLAVPRSKEVMMSSSSHGRRPPLECGSNLSGMSTPVCEKGVVDEVIEELLEQVHPGETPEEAMAKIEVVRERLLHQAQVLASIEYRMESNIREYQHVHGLTPANQDPSRLGSVQRRGGELGARFEQDTEPASRMYLPPPVYHTAVKNVWAARAIAEDLPHLEGEEMLCHF